MATEAQGNATEAARGLVGDAAAEAQRAAIEVSHEHAEAAAVAAQHTAIAAAREHAEAASEAARQGAVAEARAHTEAAVAVANSLILDELSVLRRELARLTAVLDSRTSTPPSDDLGTRRGGPTSPVGDAFYVALEDRFRGDVEAILERQSHYVDFVAGIVDDDHPVLDLGCGRGEWLRALAARSVPARGVDSNAASVTECVAAGLDVVQGELLDTLRASADHEFGAITLFQVVEHLPFELLVDVTNECARALRPGGVVIMETPNALNLRVAASHFWLDPTHQRPLHPELLRFLAARAGFVGIEDVFANDLGTAPMFSDLASQSGAWLRELARAIDGPGDYALVARTPTTSVV